MAPSGRGAAALSGHASRDERQVPDHQPIVVTPGQEVATPCYEGTLTGDATLL